MSWLAFGAMDMFLRSETARSTIGATGFSRALVATNRVLILGPWRHRLFVGATLFIGMVGVILIYRTFPDSQSHVGPADLSSQALKETKLRAILHGRARSPGGIVRAIDGVSHFLISGLAESASACGRMERRCPPQVVPRWIVGRRHSDMV